MFKLCRKQSSSTTFICQVDEEKFKKFKDEIIDESVIEHIGDVPSKYEEFILLHDIFPNFKDLIKSFDMHESIVVDESGQKDYSFSSENEKGVGLLVITPELEECSVKCPWCYARMWKRDISILKHRNKYLYLKFLSEGNLDFEKIKDKAINNLLDYELANKIYYCLTKVSELSVVYGGSIEPEFSFNDITTELSKKIQEIRSNITYDLFGEFRWIFSGISLTNWISFSDFKIEFLSYYDCIALTVLDQELREIHPKFKNINEEYYTYKLIDIVESLRNSTIYLAFIFPYYPKKVFEKLFDELKPKYTKNVVILFLFPHEWFDSLVYNFIKYKYEEIIHEFFMLPFSESHLSHIAFDVCFIKYFTGIDLCSRNHWRIYIPSLYFEEVNPCPRGGECQVDKIRGDVDGIRDS